MMKTRGATFLKNGGLRILGKTVPKPEPGEVQVETSVCGICALDTYAFKHGLKALSFTPPMGHEGVSYVLKTGPGVKDLKPGDRVAGGSFARISNIAEDALYRLPASDLGDEHWIAEPVSCVVTGLDLCRLLPGDRVAVIGCGFFGLMFIQGLVNSYADRVIGFDINRKRLELAEQFGADAVYDAKPQAVKKHLKKLKALDIDVVIDTTGLPAGLALAEEIVKTGGRINLFGWNHGQGVFSGNRWHLGGYTVVNSSPFGRIRDTYPAAIRIIEKGLIDLRPLVTHVVPFNQMNKFLKSLTAGKEPGYIKGVVKLKP